MREKGFIIDKEGMLISFGIHDNTEIVELGNDKCFIEEVVDTPYFQFLNLNYDINQNVYKNAEKLSQQGLLFVFNEQKTFTPTQILSYVPSRPTRKQLTTLSSRQPELDQIEIKDIYELHSSNYLDTTDYSSFQEYINAKNKMIEQGIVIFPNGSTLSFGTYFCPDEEEYKTTPVHEKNFTYEITTSAEFRLSDFIYNDNQDLYHNALRLSLEGLIIILNKQQSTNSPTEILGFVPKNPTQEQLDSLEVNEILSKIEIQTVHEFDSFNFDDKVTFEGINNYIEAKKEDLKKKC